MFNRRSVLASSALFLLACSPATVNLRVDDVGTETREVQKQDCSTYDTRGEALRAGIDFGVLFGAARGGVYVEKSKIAGVNWDKSVRYMVLQYKELCGRYNSAGLSLAAYNTRLAEIDQLWAEAQGIRQSIDETIRGHGQASFAELDRETPGKSAPSDDDRQRIAGAIDALVAKLGAQ
jgi:hypothetical protein